MRTAELINRFIHLAREYPGDVNAWVVPSQEESSEPYWFPADDDILDVRVTTVQVQEPMIELGVLAADGSLKLYFLGWTNTREGFNLTLELLSEAA